MEASRGGQVTQDMAAARDVAIDDLPGLVGTVLGPTPWREVTQEQVNGFADATGDHQWIHIDVERANAGPFGGPIAHGFLTLSLAPVLISGLLHVSGAGLTVNYGLGKVRFPAPVPVGTAVRATAEIAAVDEVAGGLQVTLALTVERDGGSKPVCVAEILFRYYREGP